MVEREDEQGRGLSRGTRDGPSKLHTHEDESQSLFFQQRVTR